MLHATKHRWEEPPEDFFECDKCGAIKHSDYFEWSDGELDFCSEECYSEYLEIKEGL